MSQTTTAWGDGVTITAPALYSLRFEWKGGPDPDVSRATTEYSLSVVRFEPLQLGIQFGATVIGIPDLEASAWFRMIVTLRPESPEAADPDRAFRQLAARVGPVAMYPFIREAIASAAMKAQLPGLVLPIANVGGLFDEDEITIPPPDADGDADPDSKPRSGA